MMNASEGRYASGENRRLDLVVEVSRSWTSDAPLHEVLDVLPGNLAEIFDAEVCSIYLLEAGGLALRGNVGFAPDVLADVRLRPGEGLTGVAVESMRPISLSAAPTHAAFYEFSQLPEERFPVFLAVPISGPKGAVGALVLQRRDGAPFADHDVELAVALAAPLAAIVHRSKLVDQRAETAARSKRRNAPRVTLPGRSVVRGKGVGRLSLAPRPSMDKPPAIGERGRDNAERLLAASRERVVAVLRGQRDRARDLGLGVELFSDLGLVLDDGRVRDRVLELCDDEMPLSRALCTAAGEVVRSASHAKDTFAVARAAKVSDVCEALALLASGLPRITRGAVLAAERLTLADLLMGLATPPTALVLRAAPTPSCHIYARLMGVPGVADVGGLFRWVAEEDLVLVDGDHGLVRVNPRRGEVALVRETRNRMPRDPAEQAQNPANDSAK